MPEKPPLKLFWPTRPSPGNFGDLLGPVILRHYGYRVEHGGLGSARLFSCGSVAKLATPGSVVLGSGVISSYNDVDPTAHWIWVRGPLTRHRVLASGGQCPEIYGDPALLMPRIVAPSPRQYFDLGIVPHYVDYEFVKSQYPDHRVINVLNQDPRKVVRAVTECRKIISSSLHGLIVAQAYGIPAAWVRFSDNLAGDGVKFQDYYQSVGLGTQQPSSMEQPEFLLGEFDDSEINQILTQGSWLDFLA